MKKLIIALAALTAGGAAFAQAPDSGAAASTAAPTSDSAAAAPDPNERICRNVETTATRLGRKRECKTRAEWEAQFRQAGENAARAQSRSQN